MTSSSQTEICYAMTQRQYNNCWQTFNLAAENGTTCKFMTIMDCALGEVSPSEKSCQLKPQRTIGYVC